MKCPTCNSTTRVLETRGTRRRRECAQGHRFTTFEVPASMLIVGRHARTGGGAADIADEIRADLPDGDDIADQVADAVSADVSAQLDGVADDLADRFIAALEQRIAERAPELAEPIVLEIEAGE